MESRFSYRELLQTLQVQLGSPLSDKVKSTLRLAYEGHSGQFRSLLNPDERIPFIVHPVGTALLVIEHYKNTQGISDDLETCICTALIHDLLEDTQIDSNRVREIVGEEVQLYAEALTKPPADLTGRNAEERNRDFLDRIVRSGPTAVFIKICDSMHNLSRIGAAPVKLAEKSLLKANNQYLSLLDQCPLGEQFKEAYCSAITQAEAQLEQNMAYISHSPVATSLDDAINICTTQSSGKILELHDIVDTLKQACDSERVTVWRYIKNKGTLIPSTKSTITAQVKAFNHWLVPVVLKGKEVTRFPIGLSGDGDETIFTVPMPIDMETHFVVVIGYDRAGPAQWLSLNSVNMLVQFLAHRLILSRSTHRANLASTAASLGMQVDVDLALAVQVQPSDLTKIQQWQNHCKQAIAIVEHWLNNHIISNRQEIPLWELVRIESRVKSVTSILRKFNSNEERVWPEYNKIEDIAGVRVICPTQTCAHLVEQFLLSDSACFAGIRTHPGILNNRRDYVCSPSVSGYRALHLIMEVDVQLGKAGEMQIPCEIQLRTIFQDAWASISHTTLYRASREDRRKLGNKLREMGAALEYCDQLTEDLIGYNNSHLLADSESDDSD